MALTGGYLVLTRDQERLIEMNTLIKPARKRFKWHFSGFKNRFTFLWKVALTERWRWATELKKKKKTTCEGRNAVNGVIQFLFTHEMVLKEHPRSNPGVNQNKTRMSNYRLTILYSQKVKLSTWDKSFYTASRGKKKKCFQFCSPPMPPLLQLLSTNVRIWEMCSLAKTLDLLIIYVI